MTKCLMGRLGHHPPDTVGPMGGNHRGRRGPQRGECCSVVLCGRCPLFAPTPNGAPEKRFEKRLSPVCHQCNSARLPGVLLAKIWSRLCRPPKRSTPPSTTSPTTTPSASCAPQTTLRSQRSAPRCTPPSAPTPMRSCGRTTRSFPRGSSSLSTPRRAPSPGRTSPSW